MRLRRICQVGSQNVGFFWRFSARLAGLTIKHYFLKRAGFFCGLQALRATVISRATIIF
jgi:hypothetical protein